jgi:hypothetical protein
MFAIACGLLLKIKQRVSSRPDHKFPPKNGFGRLAVVGGRDLISCELVAYSTAIFQVRLLHVLKQAKQYLRARRVVAALTDFGDDFALSSNVLLAQRHVTVDFGEMFNQDRPVHKGSTEPPGRCSHVSERRPPRRRCRAPCSGRRRVAQRPAS